MEGDVDAGLAPPIFLHNQTLPGRFSDASPMARKRDLPWGNPGFHHVHHKQEGQQWFIGSGLSTPSHSNSWNPKMWKWDSVRFSSKPSEDVPEVLCLGTQGVAGAAESGSCVEQRKNMEEGGKSQLLREGMEEGENLALKLGGGGCRVEEQVGRANKRVRSGSPGSAASYPMCQVDDCKADLSNAKDYHRRHKVCEFHSKTAKALVAKQMQRFCQQCSRFHPLTEFDEGKRSCRRRLAGHNRRRRKTQPEDASTNILASESQDAKVSGSVDIANLFAILARLQGNIAGKPTSMPSVPERDQLIQIINKIGSLPPTIPSPKTLVQRSFDLNVSQAPQQSSSEQPSQGRGNLSIPSTMNLLGVLSAALASSNPNVLASMSQESSHENGSSKSREACQKAINSINSQNKAASVFPPSRDRETDFNGHSQLNSSEHSILIGMPSLPLQLFGSAGSAEDDSPPKLGSAVKYPSSESSNPIEDRSPSCSPPIAKRLFPLRSESDKKEESMSICREDHAVAEASTTCGWAPPLELFKDPDRQLDNQTVQNMPYSGGYSSSSGSDQSPSSSNCAVQERTGRIIFKLFDKDPSNLPGTLRSEILNWLSRSPTEIESYIRPGCVVLSIYLCMASAAWHELEEDFLQRVTSLVNCSGSEFWRNLRFWVRTSTQIVSHRDGKIRVCKSWRSLTAPEITSISPIAVLSGQETSVILKGPNLSIPGTKIHCTYKGGYWSKEVFGSTHAGAIYDDSGTESFILPKDSPFLYGRYFIEVDNGFRGNSFPVIIADATICEELRSLEVEFDEDLDAISEDLYQESRRAQSREDTLHFLNELGWLFQRKNHSDFPFIDFAASRFKYLLTFSVERDMSALVKKLLDVLMERCHGGDSVLNESLELLLELQLLSRAVKKKCRNMVELLLNYSVKNEITKDSRTYLFPPNYTGPGGLTPLHLAASMGNAEDMVDALTNDPQGIGLNCWVSKMDESGRSPSFYASSTNNSYNMLVARKLVDKKNGQVSIKIRQEDKSMENICAELKPAAKHVNACSLEAMAISSCAQCALAAEARLVRINHHRGFLQRPYVHSILAIAAVCVCVCLFFRGAPFVGSIAPFKWENLDFGPR
ncbi:squamosa promoter-binding-like protein 15 [Phalaenopsis equestris]|uniref:squamosa promoter-binding-like protein 15 n=1 Tax=Phalaenopsis equestris TaxID=78828 RepID=UPI0009E5DFA7|nr:squamosa promoter-binding-like protein 15 [Phalaenopsis equestris]